VTLPAYVGARARTYEAIRARQPEWHAEQACVDRWLQALPVGSTTILDAPVGTGRFLSCYAAQGLRCVGVDCSADMLAEARRKGTGAALIRGDLRALPLQAVDVAVCMRFANWLSPVALQIALYELARVAQREILIGIATDATGGRVIGGAQTHAVDAVRDQVVALGWAYARIPLTAARTYRYDAWLLHSHASH
jgi:hypothetical protein